MNYLEYYSKRLMDSSGSVNKKGSAVGRIAKIILIPIVLGTAAIFATGGGSRSKGDKPLDFTKYAPSRLSCGKYKNLAK